MRILGGVCLLALPFTFLHLSIATEPHATKKVSVSEVSFNSAVEDVQWAKNDFSVVLVVTAGGHLYSSRDSGRTWNEITHLLSGGKKIDVDNLSAPDVLAEVLMVNKVNRNIVLVVGSKHAHFISEDGGMSFRRVELHSSIHNWLFHPKRPEWALLSTWTEACTRPGGRGIDDQDCNHMLYVTRDLGRSFHLVAGYVVQFSWGDPKHSHQDRIFFTHHRHKHGPQSRSGGWSSTVDFAAIDRVGGPIRELVRLGNKFLVSNGYIFVAKLNDVELQTVTLMVSTDGGETFAPSKLPISLQEKSYTILDTSEGAVMIHVNHGDSAKSETGNVYISDADGLRFSLSLPNNVRTSSGECEFDRILSLEGVYIANFKDDNYLHALERRPTHRNGPHSHSHRHGGRNAHLHEEDEEDDDDDFDDILEELEQEMEEMEAVETETDRHRHKHGKMEEVVRTVISFDKGGVWSYLKPPRVDSRGNSVECPNPSRCWLHLHGITNFHNYAPFYSVENAIGIIMGTGNVGSQLRYEEDEVNTYLSRDGGVTWIEAHKGAYIYEFGDHGGLLVMGDDTHKSNQVVFSWNEGQSWYDFELGSAPLEIDNIVIEPNSSSVEFLLYGTRGDTGVLFHLDFAALGQPLCKGVWAADSVSSDYETWMPSDGRHPQGEHCLLGRQVTYTRRKQTSECFNGKDFDRPVFKQNCACTQEDYECEFGFTRLVDNLQCIPDMESPDILTPFCRTSGHYKTMAYRRVPGDTCQGGWVPEEVEVPCPPHSPFSTGAKTVLTVLFFMALFLGVVTAISKNPDWSSKLFNFGFDSFHNVKYTVLAGLGPKDHHRRAARAKKGDFVNLDDDDDFDDENLAMGVFSSKTARERKMHADTNREKYEPDLGFLESAQDQHEDDAPTLMTYNYSYRDAGASSDHETSILDMAADGKSPPSTSGSLSNMAAPRRPAGLAAATETVPRLAPPPSAQSRALGATGSGSGSGDGISRLQGTWRTED